MLNFIDGIAGNTGIQCGTVLQGQCPYFALRQSVHHNVADPTVYSSGATSSYQSLQLHLRVRHSWLQASSAFTWSHSLDDASDLFDTSGSFALPQDPTNLSAERASSNFDTRFRSASYFLADSRAKDPLLKGWQLSGILTLQSGQPFTVNTAYDLNLDGTDTVRLNTAAGLLGPGVGTNVPGLGRQTRIVLPASSLTGTPYQGAQFLWSHTALAIAHLLPHIARHLSDLSHDTGEHAHPIAQHCTIGGVVDVGLYHGGVHPQFAAADYLLSVGLSDDALVQLLHHRGAQQQSQLADGLGVRRLVHPNARELAIDQIGAHFPRQYAIAPVAYVFEQQQTEHNFGGSGKPTTGAALGPSLEQGLVNDVHQLGIVEQAVGVAHPVFPPAIHW